MDGEACMNFGMVISQVSNEEEENRMQTELYRYSGMGEMGIEK